MLRATQLQPHVRHGLTEHRGMLQLAAGEQLVQRFRVRPGLTLELTLAQFWNSLGSSQLSVQARPEATHSAQARLCRASLPLKLVAAVASTAALLGVSLVEWGHGVGLRVDWGLDSHCRSGAADQAWLPPCSRRVACRSADCAGHRTA